MAQLLRAGTAVQVHVGPALTTGGFAIQTALTATGTAKRVFKHLATAAVTVTGAPVHIAVGFYRVNLTTGYTGTPGPLTLAVTATTGTNKSLPMWKDYVVVPSNVYDSLVSGGAFLKTDTTRWLTGTPSSLTSGKVQSDVRFWAGGTPAALTSGAVKGDVRFLNGSATGAANIDKSARVIYTGSVTATDGTTSTFKDSVLAGDANYLNGRIVIFLTGNLKYQASKIAAYATGTDQVTVSGAFTRAPASGETYVIV